MSICWVIEPTGSAALVAPSSLWVGAFSPAPSPSLTPRKNDVMYCSATRSPASSRDSTFATTVVPFGLTWMPTDAARELSTIPGVIGFRSRMSCSPCTTSISTSGGTTPAIAPAIVSQIGTTANTGGATSPLRCAGIGSLVACAYALVRSAPTLNSGPSVHCPSLSIANPMACSCRVGTGEGDGSGTGSLLPLVHVGPGLRDRLEPSWVDRRAGHFV